MGPFVRTLEQIQSRCKRNTQAANELCWLCKRILRETTTLQKIHFFNYTLMADDPKQQCVKDIWPKYGAKYI